MAARRADAAIGLLAVAAIAIGSLLALFISESSSLFGFTESGYRTPIVVAIAAEAATLTLLGPVATVSLSRVACRREPTTRHRSDQGSRLGHGAAR